MQDVQEELAWSLYWAQDRLQSCVASGDDKDQQRLDAVWQEFALSFEADARILDLATGNGAVPAALLDARTDLQVDAVDRAQIDPLRYLSEPRLLDKVTFHAETDILNMPFAVTAFDAITSQFGIEYAGFNEAAVAVIPYLKPGGRFQFIVHHADSDIIQSSSLKITEIEQLIQPDGLLDTLNAMLRGQVDFAELESQGKAYMEQDNVRTAQISGQVFTGINQLSKSLAGDTEQAMQLAATLNLRLRSEYHRLCQMKNAARTEQDMQEFEQALASSSAQSLTITPVYIDDVKQDYLLAWLVTGVNAG